MTEVSADGVPEDFTKGTAAVSAVLAILTSVGGGALTLGGGAERMFRENPLFATVAVLCAGLAVALLAIGLASARSKAQRLRAFAVSIIFFFAALASATVAVVLSSGSADEPGITGSFAVVDGQPTLEVTVTATGVRSDERMNLLVSGVTEANRLDPSPLLATVVGADRDGHVSATFSVHMDGLTYDKVAVAAWAVRPRAFFCDAVEKGSPIFERFCDASGQPDCNVVAHGENERAACLVMTVPATRLAPALDLSLVRDADGLSLKGSLASLPRRNAVVYLWVYGSIREERGEALLYSEKLVPNLKGSIQASLDVALDPDLESVCVVAVEGPADAVTPPGCPVGTGGSVRSVEAGVTWLDLTAPPRPSPDATASAAPMPTATTDP